MLDTPMCLTFAINILVAMGTVTWRIPQLRYGREQISAAILAS